MDKNVLDIKKYPDSILRKKSSSVEEIGQREIELFEALVFTMHTFKGIGLAAPQIGISYRLIVADINEGIVRLANPQILKVKGKDKMSEGCLSIPDLSVNVKRSYEVVVKGLNEKGEEIEIKAKGLLARVLQHEIDHLNGRLIIDYQGFLARLRRKKGAVPFLTF